MVAKRDDSEAFAHLHRPALCNGWQHRNTNGSTVAYTVKFLWTAMYIHAKPVAVIFSSELTGLLHNFSEHVVF